MRQGVEVRRMVGQGVHHGALRSHCPGAAWHANRTFLTSRLSLSYGGGRKGEAGCHPCSGSRFPKRLPATSLFNFIRPTMLSGLKGDKVVGLFSAILDFNLSVGAKQKRQHGRSRIWVQGSEFVSALWLTSPVTLFTSQASLSPD